MDYKILIADDEPEIRNLLRLYLENENYHVIEAEDGQRALDLLRAEQPALCILDIMMPKMISKRFGADWFACSMTTAFDDSDRS